MIAHVRMEPSVTQRTVTVHALQDGKDSSVLMSVLWVSLARDVQRDAHVRTVQDAIRRWENASVLQDGEENSVTKLVSLASME